MQDLVIRDAAPDATLRNRAIERLSHIVETHAALRLDEVRRNRDSLEAELQRAVAPSRARRVDLQRAHELVGQLRAMHNMPRATAESRLDQVLPLVGGVLECLEFDRDGLAGCVAPATARGRHVRVLLRPAAMRSERIQVEELRAGWARPVIGRGVPCYGRTALDYFIYALNRLDLRTLFLVAAGYLRMN